MAKYQQAHKRKYADKSEEYIEAEAQIKKLDYGVARTDNLAKELAKFGTEMGDVISMFISAQPQKVDLDDPEVVCEQISKYFTLCAEKNVKPGVEGICLSLGCSRSTLYERIRGEIACDSETRVIFEQVLQNLAALHEYYGLHGKLNPATFIFLAKNNYGYKDNVEVSLQHVDEEEIDVDEIRKRFK